MDYIEHEKEFFAPFVIGEHQTMDNYIEYKRKDGVWGDHIEIQAMAEIYNVGIEVYSYNNTPMITLNQTQIERGNLIRLSYH